GPRHTWRLPGGSCSDCGPPARKMLAHLPGVAGSLTRPAFDTRYDRTHPTQPPRRGDVGATQLLVEVCRTGQRLLEYTAAEAGADYGSETPRRRGFRWSVERESHCASLTDVRFQEQWGLALVNAFELPLQLGRQGRQFPRVLEQQGQTQALGCGAELIDYALQVMWDCRFHAHRPTLVREPRLERSILAYRWPDSHLLSRSDLRSR